MTPDEPKILNLADLLREAERQREAARGPVREVPEESITHRAIEQLREQLAAAQEEVRNERTRAEAAEQELREHNRQREIEKRVLWSVWEWFDDHDDRKTSAEIHYELQQVVGEWHGRVVDDSGIATYGAAGLAAKLAAIRAHLTSIDWQALRQLAEEMHVQEDSVAVELDSVIEAAWEAHKP